MGASASVKLVVDMSASTNLVEQSGQRSFRMGNGVTFRLVAKIERCSSSCQAVYTSWHWNWFPASGIALDSAGWANWSYLAVTRQPKLINRTAVMPGAGSYVIRASVAGTQPLVAIYFPITIDPVLPPEAILAPRVVASAKCHFKLDASKSYDASDSDAVLLYSWRCTTGDLACSSVGNTQESIVTFAAHSLLPGSYTFEVTVTREGDGSSGVANTSVEVVAAAQPVVAMPMPTLVNRSTRKIKISTKGWAASRNYMQIFICPLRPLNHCLLPLRGSGPPSNTQSTQQLGAPGAAPAEGEA